MAFTAQLGISDSKLANIVLGFGSDPGSEVFIVYSRGRYQPTVTSAGRYQPTVKTSAVYDPTDTESTRP